jgi:hypothetical protein
MRNILTIVTKIGNTMTKMEQIEVVRNNSSQNREKPYIIRSFGISLYYRFICWVWRKLGKIHKQQRKNSFYDLKRSLNRRPTLLKKTKQFKKIKEDNG